MRDREVRRPRVVVRHVTLPPAPDPSPTAAPVDDARQDQPFVVVHSPGDDSPDGFPTERLLAEQAGAADALRADLDRLRRQIDRVTPAPPPIGRRRRPLLAVLVVGLVGAAIVTAVLVRWSTLGDDRDATGSAARQTPMSAAAVPAATGTTGSRASTKTTTAPAPRTPPAGTLPANGPGVDGPGEIQVVQVARDGSLAVVEQAVMGPGNIRALSLRLPSMAALGGSVARLTPGVEDLRAAVNGTPVAVVPTADGPGWAVDPADGNRVRRVRISYRMTDAVIRSRPATAGRALGVSLPLLGQLLRDQGLPMTVTTLGADIGGVTCPSAPTNKILCGSEIPGGWQAQIPPEAANPTLLIQLTLDR